MFVVGGYYDGPVAAEDHRTLAVKGGFHGHAACGRIRQDIGRPGTRHNKNLFGRLQVQCRPSVNGDGEAVKIELVHPHTVNT